MNRKIFSAILVAATTFVVATTSEAQLSTVCPKIVSVSGRGAGALVQWKNNQVQRRGGVGSPLAGFLRQPTIISTQGRNPFTLGRATIYNKSGKSVCSSGPRMGCAKSRGECLSRYKFNCSTTSVRKATTGGAYVKVASNLCINIPNAGKCYNVKVRDLCDGRTL
jgi:hypothetical protein